jgi:hypothetical protein
MRQVNETTEAWVYRQLQSKMSRVEKVKNSLITQQKKPSSDFFNPDFRRYFAQEAVAKHYLVIQYR